MADLTNQEYFNKSMYQVMGDLLVAVRKIIDSIPPNEPIDEAKEALERAGSELQWARQFVPRPGEPAS